MTNVIKVSILPPPTIILETFINVKNNSFTDSLFLFLLLLFNSAQEIFLVEILCYGVQNCFRAPFDKKLSPIYLLFIFIVYVRYKLLLFIGWKNE